MANVSIMQDYGPPTGTGARFQRGVTILAGASALAATLLTCVSVWLQFKNYRKPLLQRYVVRILLMVPIYSIASFVSLVSTKAAFWIDPFRDVYEAFTIYAFFQLLINFIGGERALIIMMHGRPPVSHPWPLNQFLGKIDISDPHTFLAIKRGILQYTWIKPVLAFAAVIMKAAGVYSEGHTSIYDGYLWSSIIYNVSITISLYALAMFWVCMHQDLKPFRPMPKFLCIKGIIFASYWQGFILSVLVALKAFPEHVRGYSPETLGAAIQDALICFEMPFFAVVHWYAFSWHDYADITISAARMPVKFAVRDAFGPRDLIEDAKETFAGNKYEYRHFDAEDNVIAHEESAQRKARMSQGMRYARGGKGKYWIPQPGAASSRTPLLRHSSEDSDSSVSPARAKGSGSIGYGATSSEALHDTAIDGEDEKLFASARALEFGDWNYPVITAHHASCEDRLHRDPNVITPSTNRNILQPTEENRRRRQSRIADIQETHVDGQHQSHRSSSTPATKGKSQHQKTSGPAYRSKSASGHSGKSDQSQLVDLVVEDEDAEEAERVRMRKAGNPSWVASQHRHLVNARSGDALAEQVQETHNEQQISTREARESLDHVQGSSNESVWHSHVYEDGNAHGQHLRNGVHDDPEVAPNVWASPKD